MSDSDTFNLPDRWSPPSNRTVDAIWAAALSNDAERVIIEISSSSTEICTYNGVRDAILSTEPTVMLDIIATLGPTLSTDEISSLQAGLAGHNNQWAMACNEVLDLTMSERLEDQARYANEGTASDDEVIQKVTPYKRRAPDREERAMTADAETVEDATEVAALWR